MWNFEDGACAYFCLKNKKKKCNFSYSIDTLCPKDKIITKKMLQFCCNPNVHILSHFVEGSPNAGKGKKVEINNVDPNSPLRIIDRNRQKTFIKAWWFWNKKRKLGKIDPASSQIWLLTFTSQTQLFCIPISPSQNREKKKKYIQ